MPMIETGRIRQFCEEAGVGDPPILLIHELGGSSASFTSTMPLFVAQRRVIAVPSLVATGTLARRALSFLAPGDRDAP